MIIKTFSLRAILPQPLIVALAMAMFMLLSHEPIGHAHAQNMAINQSVPLKQIAIVAPIGHTNSTAQATQPLQQQLDSPANNFEFLLLGIAGLILGQIWLSKKENTKDAHEEE